MKLKIIYLPVFLITMTFFSACDDYLDPEVRTDLTYDQITKSYNYSRSRVAGIYGSLQAGFMSVDGAMLASTTDEAEHTQEISAVQKFNTGSWNAYSNPDNVWSRYYGGIRKANQFLVSADSVDLDIYKYDPNRQDVYETYINEINRWKNEVRFLRAYFYFELVKRYGGVPLLISANGTVVDSYNDIQRNTLRECIDFILDECDAVVPELPAKYGDDDLGRATKGMALALKSRLLLYAASDLFNTISWTEGYPHTELISLSGDRQARWKAAAEAAKVVIDLSEAGYSLSTNYSDLFNSSTFTNNEMIFCVRSNSSNSFEFANIPVGYNMGQSGTTPSQDLVDAYEMADGKMIDDPASGYDSQEPYEGRDPRLRMTILLNNTSFKGRPVECWTGGQDGLPIPYATKTGYYLKKYVNDNLNLLTGQQSVHSWIIFRLAEMYLNYAEALNEYDTGNPDIERYVNMVRQRNGVAMPDLPSRLSQSEMRERIRRERRVEFAFEGQRSWDLRRWMTAENVLSSPLRGMKITKTEDDSFQYETINVENRVFLPRMYFYPIPQSELNIASGLIQNPLWQ